MDSKLQTYIDKCKQAVFFGGAGTSTESGIPDFRSADGIYSQKSVIPPEKILSRSFFESNPEEFFRFYRGKMIYLDAQPNPAHRRLARLEEEGKLIGVITQNIDGLHQKAGSRNVIELHGSIFRNHCMRCGTFHTISAITQSTGVPKCACGGTIKPDVVLYEERLDDRVLEQAVKLLQKADLLIVGGTSLNVYPAAGLLQHYGGKDCVVINMAATGYDEQASLLIQQPIGTVMA
ncbi:MAG: NAD-dependent protein deacylase [Oscillospiraceae bacterium]|jgi:NAD-dependent deacetylase|nr:NAD-dependent protein deacylase [Oscillospiraceae bacterium]